MGDIVAVLIMDDDAMMENIKCCHLVSIVVKKDCEGKGYGSSLLRHGQKKLKLFQVCPFML